jgi:chromosome segregation ATPase
MRKAFETNVPRLKPRLRAAPGVEEAERPATVADLPPTPADGPIAADPPDVEARDVEVAEVPAAPAAPVVTPRPPRAERLAPPQPAPRARQATVQPERQGDVLTRRDRLEKIKRKVAEAARPAPRHDPVPADPARAAESVLTLVGELEGELTRVREREEALRSDLDGARAELARAAGEARGGAERLAAAEQELSEKREVLTELLAEMEALEQERDEAVRRAQALSALDEERARLLEEVTHRAEREAASRAEREAEVERLGEELRASAADGARLRSAVGELARERDQMAAELDRLRGERDELASAKRALEQVHAALAQARAKLG